MSLQDPRAEYEAEVQRWMAHRGTPPIVSSPAWEEAQRRKMGGSGNPLQDILKQLMGGAGPRGATFGGRVIPHGQAPNLKALLTQMPIDVPEESYGVMPGMDFGQLRAMKGGMLGGPSSLQEFMQKYTTGTTAIARQLEEQEKRKRAR